MPRVLFSPPEGREREKVLSLVGPQGFGHPEGVSGDGRVSRERGQHKQRLKGNNHPGVGAGEGTSMFVLLKCQV